MALIRPGYFSVEARADELRGVFDCRNGVLVHNDVKVDVVFFGDSITQMWELDAYFHSDGLIVNRGIGGDTTTFGAKRFEADVVQLKPDLCVFKMGINDAWDLEFDYWKQQQGKSLDEVLDHACQNLRTIAVMAKQAGIQMAFCSVLPTNMQFTNAEELRKEYVNLLNPKIQALCQEFGFIYVDYHSHLVLADGKTVNNELMIEGLHPHVLGYNIMAKVLKDTLQSHGFFL